MQRSSNGYDMIQANYIDTASATDIHSILSIAFLSQGPRPLS